MSVCLEIILSFKIASSLNFLNHRGTWATKNRLGHSQKVATKNPIRLYGILQIKMRKRPSLFLIDKAKSCPK